MAYVPVENRLGGPLSFSQIDNVAAFDGATGTFANAKFPVGSILRGQDTGLTPPQSGEFIYLPGVAANAVGTVVTYNATTYVVTVLATSAKNTANPLAVSMSANTTTTNFSWYQIEGIAVVLKTAVTVNPQVALYSSATAGRLRVIASAGQQILGARSANLATVTSTTSTISVLINRPWQQGQIT